MHQKGLRIKRDTSYHSKGQFTTDRLHLQSYGLNDSFLVPLVVWIHLIGMIVQVRAGCGSLVLAGVSLVAVVVGVALVGMVVQSTLLLLRGSSTGSAGRLGADGTAHGNNDFVVVESGR